VSRIYWDTMLFIYLLEDHPVHADRAEHLLRRHRQRGDQICSSYLGLGELMAGAYRKSDRAAEDIREAFLSTDVRLLPWDERAAGIFGRLRATVKLSSADAIHLACAAAGETDLFLTADKQLTKLIVPGIHFIADLDTELL
jgi:predicted nucleic acid-binding protein